MNILGIIGIVLGLVAIVLFSVKGLNTIIGAPLATLIVIIFNQMDVFGALLGPKNSYIAALANFIIANFAIFLLGSMLAQYMEKSGATIAISDRILKVIGADKPYSVFIALFLIASVLTLGGISMFVVCFALLPMAKPLFKKLDIAWNLVTIPVFAGMATFTMSMFPGTPAIPNVIAANSLGTPLTAAPLVGIVASIVTIVYCLFYMNYALKKSLKKGETFSTYVDEEKEPINTIAQENLPSFFASMVPVIVLFFTILLFSKINNIVLIALSLAILLAAILFRRQIPLHISVLNAGATGAITPALTTGSTIAFGSLLTSVPAFLAIKNAIIAIPGNPLISLSLATMLLSGITGSSVGSVGIAMDSFAQTYIHMGIAPAIVHRIVSISSAVFGVMPHTGLVITFNVIASLNLKQSYKYQFMTVNVGHALALIAAIITVALIGA